MALLFAFSTAAGSSAWMLLSQIVLLLGLSGMGHGASSKRGFGINFETYFCNDTNSLSGSTWWYDWRSHPDEHAKHGCSSPLHGEYVPMVWSRYGIDANSLSFPVGTRHVLGFNEPNQKDQANLSPQEAARLWRSVESKAHGMKLVSPAPSRCHSGPNCHMSPFQWYDQFFAACKGCRVDALGAHTYSCNAHDDMNYLETLHKKYHRKIWLTEFSCPHTNDETKVESYMREIIPMLERASFVERYAWFITRWKNNGFLSTAVGLLHLTNSHPTSLGKLYNSL